ncbi:MAG: magnesium transporter [Verrucomicrobia bacterium]|nr:magnesium transporter [Verrucomicrobiota bacterium]
MTAAKEPGAAQAGPLHPADLADHLQALSAEEAARVLKETPLEKAAAALAEMDTEAARSVLEHFEPKQLATLLQRLPSHLAADLAGLLDTPEQTAVLGLLPSEESSDVRSLLQYPPDAAGGIMSKSFISLRADQMAEEALRDLQRRPKPGESDISYLYVTDAENRLVGVVPLRSLVFASPGQRVGEIMSREVRAIRADADREELARQFERYHFLALPVVDEEGRLLGIVKASDALEAAKDEATEDMQLMVGLSGEEHVTTPWQRAVSRRLPWLLVNLGTAFLAGWVVGLFQDTIARWTALAVFLPIIAGQGGNAGMQTLTIIVRDLATGDLPPALGWRALSKELLVGLLNGLAIGLVVGVIGWLWQGNWLLGLVAGAAMFLNLVAAAFAGVCIPLGLRLFRLDPALASSIFLTTVTDVAGFFFFLGLAAFALKYFHV